MSDLNSNNKRIAKNSIILYLRMILVMGVSLFTSRVVLQSLGVDDFGIYNLVGGIAAMFNVFLGSMTDATQRFLTVELGKGDRGNINKVFSTSLLIHLILGVLIVLVAEPTGLWFIKHKLLIPEDRMTAAIWVFQCSIVSVFILSMSIPYNALIIAHESMKAFAYISTIDALLRLGIAYLVLVNVGIDKLVFYAILMMLSQVLLRFIYTFYCKRKFKESSFNYIWDGALVKEMGVFASWTVFGNASWVFSNQGLNLLLGSFFMPYVNAARGISTQVQSAVLTFVKSFQTAVNPQITKNFAAGDLNAMSALLYKSSKLSFFLILIPLIPLISETDFILSLWLKTVPEYTSTFVRITLVTVLFTTLINPLEVAIKATGKIKRFELFVYGSKLLVLPVAYIFLKLGLKAPSVFFVSLFFEVIAFLLSCIEFFRLTKISSRDYCIVVILRCLIVVGGAIILPILLMSCIPTSITQLALKVSVLIIWTILISVILGLDKNERALIVKFLIR